LELFRLLPHFLARPWNGLLRRASAHRWVRRLEAYSSAIAFEQVAIEEGLRAATGIATMVAAAVWLHRPGLAPAAFGAFWACLADPGGTYRSRFAFMGLFAGAGTITAFIASATAGIGPFAAAAALVPLVFLPSLSAMYGAEASRVGTLVCVVAAVAVAIPNPPAAALQLAGVFLLGCVWAMVLCIGIWRIQHFAPARRAIAKVFGQLGAMTSGLLKHDDPGPAARFDWDAFNAEHRRCIRATIEWARGVVAVLETSNPRYRIEIEVADRIFAALIAIAHALAERGPPFEARTERDLLHRLLLLLAEAQSQAARRIPQPARLFSEAAVLQNESTAIATVIGRGIGAATTALTGLANAWRSAPRLPGAPELVESRTARLLKPIPATALTHAVRVAIAVVIAYALGSWLNLTFSYWATMAAVVVVQPEAASIWQRSIERMVGSIAGGVLAALLIFALPSKIALLALIFPMAAATIAFRLVNYTIFVLFVTTLFVLVTELLQPVSGIVSVRVLNNVIGSLVGLGASRLLWRVSGAKRPAEVLAEAVQAHFAYTAGVLGATGTAAEVESLRRAAGLASNAAEAMQHRMALEGQSGRAHLAEMAELLHALRRLAGSAIAASLASLPGDPARAAGVVREAVTLAEAIEGRPGAMLPTVPAGEPQDDVDRALHGVTVAGTAYVEAFQVGSSTLAHASQ
jgi:uncharacterized membrane protein YccC